MVSRLFLIYAVVELATIFALVSTVGWGWTLLALLACFLLGWAIVAPIAGSQLIRRIARLRSGRTEPRDVAGDSALLSLAAVLVLVPGLVSTALGLLLLIPPVRSAARPALTAVATRTLQRRMPVVSYAAAFGPESFSPRAYSEEFPQAYSDYRYDRHDYIDGEVIDVRDVESPGRRASSAG